VKEGGREKATALVTARGSPPVEEGEIRAGSEGTLVGEKSNGIGK